MIDTSLLIEYYRKAKKDETRLYQHAVAGKKLVVSAISEYEILNGAKPQQIEEKGSVLTETRNNAIAESVSSDVEPGAQIQFGQSKGWRERSKTELKLKANGVE